MKIKNKNEKKERYAIFGDEELEDAFFATEEEALERLDGWIKDNCEEFSYGTIELVKVESIKNVDFS